MEKMMEKLKEISVGKILDIATGQGEFIHFLKDAFKKYDKITAIDFSAPLLERAQKGFTEEKIEFKQMDAFNLDFEDSSFDVVAISNSLHHFDKPEKILKEIERVLKPQGYLIVHEMVCDNLSDTQKSHMKIHHWCAGIDRILGINHNDTYSQNELVELVKTVPLQNFEEVRYDHEIEDVHDSKMVERYMSVFDYMLKRLDGHEQYDAMAQEAEELKGWLKTHGYAPASFIFMLGQK